VVLVIDDDPGVLELLTRFLTKERFRVVTAQSGAEGLTRAAELLPTAITLDVVMPGMDGWSVLKSLKSNPVLATIPVILVTMTDDMAKGFALGAADFLTKPIDRARLLTTLEKLRPKGLPGSVLVVEDDPDSRDVLARMLSKEGFRIETANNGREALACVAAAKPDAILLDLMMPEMNGFELLAELRSHPEWRGIRVVVVTAKELTEEDRKLLRGNVEQVFRKGAFGREELLRELRDLLSAHGATTQVVG
jgi:CheY-like chemotaxis protein